MALIRFRRTPTRTMNRRHVLALCSVLFACSGAIDLAHAQDQNPQALKTSDVKTPNGTLRGVISADDKVRTFKGVPYAAPPVGPLRWKQPQPAQALDWGSASHRVWRALYAGPHLSRT